VHLAIRLCKQGVCAMHFSVRCAGSDIGAECVGAASFDDA
jgi:hypothetical protein